MLQRSNISHPPKKNHDAVSLVFWVVALFSISDCIVAFAPLRSIASSRSPLILFQLGKTRTCHNVGTGWYSRTLSVRRRRSREDGKGNATGVSWLLFERAQEALDRSSRRVSLWYLGRSKVVICCNLLMTYNMYVIPKHWGTMKNFVRSPQAAWASRCNLRD